MTIIKFNHGEVYNDDCIIFLDKLIKHNIICDAIICDPPYNISKKNNFNTIGRAGIDFGKWDYTFDQLKWIEKCNPILKAGGSIIIFNDWKNMGDISKKLEQEGFVVKDLIRWIKTNPMPRNTTRRYVTDFEFAIWAVKPKAHWTFNKDDQYPYLRPEYKTSLVLGPRRIHPTQKNLTLMQEILKVHTNKGDMVVDPFCGSGTTGEACILEDRYFLLNDIDKNYFDLTCERMCSVEQKH